MFDFLMLSFTHLTLCLLTFRDVYFSSVDLLSLDFLSVYLLRFGVLSDNLIDYPERSYNVELKQDKTRN